MFPGLVIAALVGVPLLAGGGAGIVVAALAIALAARAPGVGREVAVAVVVTTLFGAGALLALSPASPPGIQTLLFGDILATSDTDLLLAGALAARDPRRAAFLHGRLLAVGFDRSAARSLGASPASPTPRCWSLIAAAILVAVQGLGNLLVVAVLVGPGRDRSAAVPADGADDGLAQSRSRSSPASPASTSPTTRAPPPAPRSPRRWCCLPGRGDRPPRLAPAETG